MWNYLKIAVGSALSWRSIAASLNKKETISNGKPTGEDRLSNVVRRFNWLLSRLKVA